MKVPFLYSVKRDQTILEFFNLQDLAAYCQTKLIENAKLSTDLIYIIKDKLADRKIILGALSSDRNVQNKLITDGFELSESGSYFTIDSLTVNQENFSRIEEGLNYIKNNKAEVKILLFSENELKDITDEYFSSSISSSILGYDYLLVRYRSPTRYSIFHSSAECSFPILKESLLIDWVEKLCCFRKVDKLHKVHKFKNKLKEIPNSDKLLLLSKLNQLSWTTVNSLLCVKAFLLEDEEDEIQIDGPLVIGHKISNNLASTGKLIQINNYYFEITESNLEEKQRASSTPVIRFNTDPIVTGKIYDYLNISTYFKKFYQQIGKSELSIHDVIYKNVRYSDILKMRLKNVIELFGNHPGLRGLTKAYEMFDFDDFDLDSWSDDLSFQKAVQLSILRSMMRVKEESSVVIPTDWYGFPKDKAKKIQQVVVNFCKHYKCYMISSKDSQKGESGVGLIMTALGIAVAISIGYWAIGFIAQIKESRLHPTEKAIQTPPKSIEEVGGYDETVMPFTVEQK